MMGCHEILKTRKLSVFRFFLSFLFGKCQLVHPTFPQVRASKWTTDTKNKTKHKIADFVLPLTPKVVILSSLPFLVVSGTFLFLLISLLSFKLSEDLKRRRNERKKDHLY